MPLATMPNIPKKIPAKSMREFRGINKLDPFSIDERYAADMKNVSSDQYPAFKTRAGYSLLGTAFGSKILGLGTWKNSELHAISGGAWYRFTGSSWGSALVSGLNASAEWSFANFDGSFPDIQLIGANGVDAMRTFNGTTVFNLSGAPANANYVTSYMNRLFVAVGNLIHASELNIATSWTLPGSPTDSSPYQLSVDTVDGETVNALAPGIGHVTIFKPNSMHELFGSDPSNVRIEPITFEVGTINNKSVVTLNGTMFMIHRTGIYRYAGGSRPSREFSQPVQAYIDSADMSDKTKFSAGTDGKKMYFALPTAILVYDPRFDMWTVWKDISPLHMAQTATDFHMGTSDGKVIKLGGTTDNGTPIKGERVSKPFSADQMSRKIRWMRMWLVCDVSAGSSLSVYVSPSASGDSDWILAGTVAPKTDVQSARIIFSPAQIAQSNYMRIKWSWTGQVTVYEWDRDEIDFPIV